MKYHSVLFIFTVMLEIVQKSGAWFSYKGDKIGQGFQAVREFMKNNPEIDAEVTAAVKGKLFGTGETAGETAPDTPDAKK